MNIGNFSRTRLQSSRYAYALANATPALPTVHLSGAVSHSEGDSGTTIYTFTVTRSDATGAVSVPWAFAAGTTSANDFVGGAYPAGGTVDMADGVATGTFQVSVQGDTTVESDEDFTVSISAPAGYSLGAPSSATGTILNDDSAARAPIRWVFGYDGQSNSIGRNGPVDPVLDATDSRILQWGYDAQAESIAADPLDHVDETANTVGFGLSFAKSFIANSSLWQDGDEIMLACGGKGGTAISYWLPGAAGDLAFQARIAGAMGSAANTVLAGFLWHQGESDQGRTQAAYAADLDSVIAHRRANYTEASATTPFIVGEMLQGGAQTDVNIVAALSNISSRNGYCAFVSSTGLTDGGDNLHFDAASQRTFGGRYYPAFETAKTNAPALPGAISNLVASAGNGEADLAWSAPAANNSAITDYVVEYKTGAGSWTTFADGTSATTGATVTGLTNDTAYDFRVSAVNGVGQGPVSNTSSTTPSASAVGPDIYLSGTDRSPYIDVTNAGLTATTQNAGSSNVKLARSNVGRPDGSYYFEAVFGGSNGYNALFGIIDGATDLTGTGTFKPGNGKPGFSLDGLMNLNVNGTTTDYGAFGADAVGAVGCFAFTLNPNKVWMGTLPKGYTGADSVTWHNGDPVAGTGGDTFVCTTNAFLAAGGAVNGVQSTTLNLTGSSQVRAAPTGFVPINGA